MPVPRAVLQPHPAADLFPLLDGEEYQALVDDMREHGQREPITVHDGQILDGRNRYRACLELGAEPLTRSWDGRGSAVDFVWSMNGPRRHLTPSQKAAIAADLLPLIEAEAEARRRELGRQAAERQHHPERVVAIVPQPTDEPPTSIKSRDQVAATVGVSPRYVSDAKRVKETAPALFAKVKAGTMTLPAAVRKQDQALAHKALTTVDPNLTVLRDQQVREAWIKGLMAFTGSVVPLDLQSVRRVTPPEYELLSYEKLLTLQEWVPRAIAIFDPNARPALRVVNDGGR